MGISLVTGIPDAGRLVPGGASLAASAGDPAGVLQLSPRIVPPFGSRAINLSDEAAIVGANTLTPLPGCSLQLDNNSQGVINTVELLIDGIIISTKVFWRILINGNPVPGWNQLTILGRNGAASIARSFPPPMALQIPAGGQVGVMVLNQDGGAYTAGMSLYGWQWPATLTSAGAPANA